MTATSANISGEAEISDGREAVRQFAGKVDLIVNGGDTPGGLPSSIVDLLAVHLEKIGDPRFQGRRPTAARGLETDRLEPGMPFGPDAGLLGDLRPYFIKAPERQSYRLLAVVRHDE